MTDTTSPTILVVEDDEVSRSSLVRAMQDAGYQTIQANDGQSGLDAALAQHPDLILSDNLMPMLKGIEFLEKLRKDQWGSQVPFILLTGHFDLEIVNDIIQAGHTDFLVKDDTSLAQIVDTVRLRLSE